MSEKLILKVLDTLKHTTLSLDNSFELALQILTWSKLTSTASIPETSRLTKILLSDPSKAMAVLLALGENEGLIGKAFSSRCAQQIEPVALLPALDLVLRLEENGTLRLLDTADITLQFQDASSSIFGVAPELADLLVGLADIGPSDQVYVPWDLGGQLASRATNLAAEAYMEQPQRSSVPALISLLSPKQFQVEYSNPIFLPSAIHGGAPQKFDTAVSIPPIGAKYEIGVSANDIFHRFPERTSSGTILAVRHLLWQTSRRVVVAVPNGLLFSPGGEMALREELVRQGKIKAVISLPPGTFPKSSIRLSILVLCPAGGIDHIHFFDADTPKFREATSRSRHRLINVEEIIRRVDKSIESDESAIIPCLGILKFENAQLQVGRYVMPSDEKKLRRKMHDSPTMILGDSVKTIRPMPAVSKAEGSVEVFEVGVSDLPQFGYIRSPSRKVQIEQEVSAKNSQQFLRPLDIVLIVKGSVGKVGIVPVDVPPPGNGGWVAGQSAIVLRALPFQADPRALFVQLRSELGQKQLGRIVSGSTMQLIHLRELSQMEILVPDAPTVAQAIAALEGEEELQNKIEAIQNEQASLSAQLWALN